MSNTRTQNMCSVCIHPQRLTIDEALLSKAISHRKLGDTYGLSDSAINRHAASHISASLINASEAAEVLRADAMIDKINALENDVRRVCTMAFEAGQLDTVLRGVREITRLYELQARAMVELQKQQEAVAIETHPEWLTLRSKLLAALEAHPDARAAILEALQ